MPGEHSLIRFLEWVAGDHSSVAQWDYGSTSDGIAYHRVYRQHQLEFSESSDQADWGYWYWATERSESLSFQSGSDVNVRGAFEAHGQLANTNDTNYRPINQNWPVFGFSVGLGSVTGSVSTLYTLGLTQEKAIQFDGSTGIVPLNSLWKSYFSSETDAVSSPVLKNHKILTDLGFLLLQRLFYRQQYGNYL